MDEFQALFGGLIALFISGIQFAWLINKDILEYEFAADRSEAVLTLVTMSFFATAIFGLILGSFALRKNIKKPTYVSISYFFIII